MNNVKLANIWVIWVMLLFMTLMGVDSSNTNEHDKKEEKKSNNTEKSALLEEIGSLKGELREVLNEAESIKRKILSKMYGSQARKFIVDKVKDAIKPAEELLEKCEEKEKNVCVTPAVIKEAYARVLEEERIRKYEEEKAKIEEQKRKEEEQRRQQQQQNQPPGGGNITLPSTPPSSN